MSNKSKCSKEFKKLFYKTVSITKREIRSAKGYSKLWTNYSTVKNLISGSTKQLHSVNLMLQKKAQSVDELQQLDKNREEELERIKVEIKLLQEKIEALYGTESLESEKNKSRQLELLHETILKSCTKTYISNKNIPYKIQGFAANVELSKITPFEIDPGCLTKAEIQNALWENCFQCSSYANEWSHLFETDLVAKSKTLENI